METLEMIQKKFGSSPNKELLKNYISNDSTKCKFVGFKKSIYSDSRYAILKSYADRYLLECPSIKVGFYC